MRDSNRFFQQQWRKVFRNDLAFLGSYWLERSIIYQVQVSFYGARTNQRRLRCWKQLKGWWGEGGSEWVPPCMLAVFQLAWIPQEAISRGTVLLLYHYLNPSEFFPVWCRTRSVWLHTELWFVACHSIPEWWGVWLHVCVHTAMCRGIPHSAGTEQRLTEQLPGQLVGGHSVTHLGALEISLWESTGAGDRDVQTDVWCPQ